MYKLVYKFFSYGYAKIPNLDPFVNTID